MPISSVVPHAHCLHEDRCSALRVSVAGLAIAVVLCAAGAAGAAVVECTAASIAPGGHATIRVWLHSAGVAIAGVQNDLQLPAGVHVPGDLRCRANPAINKNGTAFALVPRYCGPGDCGWLRAIVLALHNVDPIPDGALLYECEVAVDANLQPGSYPVHVVNMDASTPDGVEVRTSGADCSLTVSSMPDRVGGSTAQPVVHAIAEPAARFTPRPAATGKPVAPAPTATATPRAAAAAMLAGEGASGAGGCQLAALPADRWDACAAFAPPALLALVSLQRRRGCRSAPL